MHSSFLSQEPVIAYTQESTNRIYNLLFCDNIGLYKNSAAKAGYPWSDLFAEDTDMLKLHGVIDDDNVETRPRILAYKLLTQEGAQINTRELLAVIVEVGLDNGLDVLAAFEDGSARYINQSEKIVVWDAPTDASDVLVDALFDAGAAAVNQIGAWKEARRPAPAQGMVRMSFIVADGLYFGEGPFEALQQDKIGGPVLEAAMKLLAFLTDQATPAA